MSRSSNRFRLLALLHLLAKAGFFGGPRRVAGRLGSWYAANAKPTDDFFIVREGGTEVVDWLDLHRRLQRLDLPVGVKRDYLPENSIWTRDAIGVHRNVLVLGIHPTAFGSNGRVCQLMRYRPTKPFDKGHVRTSDLLRMERWLRGKEIGAKRVERAIILDEQMGHFGHWLFEQLPQLRLLQNDSDLRIIYNGRNSWKKKFLVDFGWSEDQLLEYTGEEAFDVQELWTTNAGNLNKLDLYWLRKKALELYGVDSNAPKRIYVSRQGVGSRMVSNFREIQPVLSEFGIAVVRPEELGIEHSVRTFAKAEFIIGPEGSGTRNMVWSERAKVVEIFGHEVNFGQWCMAHALGFEFIPYVEERPVPDTDLRWRDIDAKGITVDPNELRRFLSRHLEG